MPKENIFVLVADNNPLDIDAIKSTLSSHNAVNYKIQTSDVGSDILKKADGKKFDLLLINPGHPI